MQTFLPYPSIEESLKCLDNKRLGKQRVESFQLITVLMPSLFPERVQSKAWRHHPACLMWKGYEEGLVEYYNCNLILWAERGFQNIKLKPIKHYSSIVMPSWFGNDSFHASHRSNLLRKKPEFYGRYGWKESNDLPYVWPVKSA